MAFELGLQERKRLPPPTPHPPLYPTAEMEEGHWGAEGKVRAQAH